ncbi:signal transduction histidine kinase [Kribbella amoyensis]|uniref:histidine kinase n=1 Tax=Kribbella amoyensis TaxID=996641 RepID=A0A561BZH0_9ACTN|nr:histidine kinase [Kribbella amoyensis]TWD84315.1 signal transduction histidine kinase [Kribbella amoyensis]
MNWQRAGDLGLWAALGFLVIVEGGSRGDPYWLMAGCLAALAAAVLLRRRRPITALAVVAAPAIVILAVSLNTRFGVPVALVPAVSYFAYSAGRRDSQLKHFVLVVCWSMVALLALGLGIHRKVSAGEAVLSWLAIVLFSLVLVVLPWLIGRYRAQQAQLAAAGWERAERIEREHQLALDRVRLRERSRIAEDMHDSVGHELSLIALRAAALEVDAGLPDRHRHAATELREAAATATERLGEIIGVLRDAEADAPVLPAHESVTELVRRAAASGLAVELDLDDVELSPMVDRAIHRVVQESLTNVGRHAPGARVNVTLRADGADVLLRIEDSGAPSPAEVVGSNGSGLTGLTERVRLVGGTLTAGPRSEGGFAVVARIPRTGGRPESPPASEPIGGTATAAERADVHRRARRGLIKAIAVPVAIGAVVGTVALGYYLVAGYSSILPPDEYDSLRIGQDESEVELVLPALQMLDPPVERTTQPDGWDCRFYRPDGPFSITYAYRLCFVDGRLVAKDVVQTGSVRPTNESETPR